MNGLLYWTLALSMAASLPAYGQPAAGAANYPNKSIRLVVPSSPGGGTDIIARLIGQGLAVTGAKRSRFAPDLPTVAESGIPGYAFDVWYGLVFPGATPRAIVAKTHAEIVRLLQSAEVGKRFSGAGVEPLTTTPEAFARMIADEIPKWQKVVKAANIRVE